MGSCDLSLRKTRGRCVKEDIIDRVGKAERSEDCRVSGLLEHGSGADCLQRPLRSRFRQQLTASVGLLCAALLPGVAQEKSRPCPTAPGHASPPAQRRHARPFQARHPAKPQRAGGLRPVPPGGRCRMCWGGRRGPLQVCGAVVVARDPSSRGTGGVRWFRRAHVWSASRHGERGQGRSVVGGCRRLGPGLGRVSSLAGGRGPGAGAVGGAAGRAVSHQARHAPGASRSPPVPGACQLPSPTAPWRWRHPARVGPAWVAGSVTGPPGHRRRSPATQQGFAGDGE
jgi:hypothetical protein